jgi:hypothetical protein
MAQPARKEMPQPTRSDVAPRRERPSSPPLPRLELKLVPRPQESDASAELRKETDHARAVIQGLRVLATFAMVRHIPGTWERAGDTLTLTKLRDAEIRLEKILSDFRDQDSEDPSVQEVLKRVTIALKDTKDAIAIFAKDAAEGTHDEAWDEPTVVDESDFMSEEETAREKTDVKDADKEDAKDTYQVQDEDLLPSEKAEITQPVDEKLEEAVNKAFEPHLSEKAEASIKQVTHVEKPMMVIPADLDSTRSLYNDVALTVLNIRHDLPRTRPIDDELFAHLVDLSKRYEEFQERLLILKIKVIPTHDDLKEEAIIADALHLIEDVRHEIHRVINRQEQKTPAPAATRARGLSAEQQAFERNMELRASLKQELEACEDELKMLVEKTKPGILPETFLPQYAGRGPIGFLARAFQPKPKINRKEFYALLSRIKKAQDAFNTAYYAPEYEERYAKKQPISKKSSIGVILEDIRGKKAKKPITRRMPLDRLGQDSDLVETWRLLTEEISRLDEDLSTPLSMPGDRVADVKISARQHAEKEEKRIRTLRRREVAVEKAAKIGIPNGAEIIKTIIEDPNAGELASRATEYLLDLSDLVNAIATRERQHIQEKLAIFEELQNAMLEKGIAIKAGNDAIVSAKQVMKTSKEYIPGAKVRMIRAIKNGKAKKPTAVDTEEMNKAA